MNSYIKTIILIISLLLCISCNKSNEQPNLTTSILVTKEYLVNNLWGPDYKDTGLSIVFKDDDSIETKINYEGGDRLEGKYQIINNKVHLLISKDEAGSYVKPKELIFVLKLSQESFKFIEYLELETKNDYRLKFWNQRKQRNNGDEILIDGDIVILDIGLVSIKNTTEFYSKPLLTSPKYTLSIWDFNNSENLPESKTFTTSIINEINPINRIGYSKNNKEWILIYKPIDKGGDSRMYINKNEYDSRLYCWVKVSDIDFVK